MEKETKVKLDERGKMFQVFDLGNLGEVLFATVKPNCVRGDHYHKKKRELFCLVKGSAVFKTRNVQTGEKKEIPLSGKSPCVLEILPWWTHSVTNIGEDEAEFLEWCDTPYNPDNPDSFREKV